MATEATDAKEKLKVLQLAIDKIEKTYGKGTIMRMGDDAVEAVEAIPTGSITLDNALGIGGYPKGRIIEIYGPESSGKTTMCLSVMAQAQKMGKTVAIIDAEHALDPLYAEKLGIDFNETTADGKITLKGTCASKKGRQVARDSQHTHGNAVDFRVAGVPVHTLRQFVRQRRLGGVGYYPKSQFVHADTGPSRTWTAE